VKVNVEIFEPVDPRSCQSSGCVLVPVGQISSHFYSPVLVPAKMLNGTRYCHWDSAGLLQSACCMALPNATLAISSRSRTSSHMLFSKLCGKTVQVVGYRNYIGCLNDSVFVLRFAAVTYKTKHSGLPAYLSDDLHDYLPTRALQSSTTLLIQQSRCFTSFTARSFTVAAADIRNSMSVQTQSTDSFETFKHRLKTELFISTYAT